MPTTTTTTTTTGSGSALSRAMLAESTLDSLDGTPVRRQLGTSTDDAAIFLEDTVDRATAQCIDASPSALALLTPQRLPPHHNAHVDVTEYDASFLGSFSSNNSNSHRKSCHTKENARSSSGGGGGSSSSEKGAAPRHSALHDVTNAGGTKLTYATGTAGSKSPTPKAARLSTSHTNTTGGGSGFAGGVSPVGHLSQRTHSHSTSLARSTPQRHRSHSMRDRSPSASEPMVPLVDFEYLQKERNRFEKMYEHQRALYEEMAEKQAETYQSLQDKIIEVVALSTRNEESKRFIRQLKREFSESRTRVMDMQNKALEEAKAERNTKTRYEALIQEHERKYERLAERHETKLAGMESLVKDLTCLRGERDRIHVSQLDSLLKAAYSKSTALFSDLLRQGRQIDLLYDAKCDLEGQLEQLRREKREMEATMREERRRMMAETERFIEQIEEQQQSILNLRQMLIRTMDNRDNVFAYSRGPRRGTAFSRDDAPDGGEEEEEEGDGQDMDDNSSSSFDSSSDHGEDDEEGDDVVREDDEDEKPLKEGKEGKDRRDRRRGKAEEDEEVERSAERVPASTVKSSRTELQHHSRPIISTSSSSVTVTTKAAPRALTSNTVVVSRRSACSSSPAAAPSTTNAAAAVAVRSSSVKAKPVEVPPLPLSSSSSSSRATGASGGTAVSSREAAVSSSAFRPEPYRIQRSTSSSSSGEGSGAVLEERTAPSSLSSTSSSTSAPRDDSAGAEAVNSSRDGRSPTSSTAAAVGSRRRLDFTSALAAVTEKRLRDRAARDGVSEGGAANRPSSPPDGSGKVESEKENSKPSTAVKRVIVRSCAVGSISTARKAAGHQSSSSSSGADGERVEEEQEEEEGEEPRLFPRAALRQREQ